MQKGVDGKIRALVKSLSQDIHSDLPEIVYKDPSLLFSSYCAIEMNLSRASQQNASAYTCTHTLKILLTSFQVPSRN